MARPDPFRKSTDPKAIYRVREGRYLKPMREVDMCFKPGTLVTLPMAYAEEHAKHLVEYVSELDGGTVKVDSDGVTRLGTAKKRASKKKASKKKTSKKKVAKKVAADTPQDERRRRRSAARKKAAGKVRVRTRS